MFENVRGFSYPLSTCGNNIRLTLYGEASIPVYVSSNGNPFTVNRISSGVDPPLPDNMTTDQDPDRSFYFQPDLCDEYLDELDRLFDRFKRSPKTEWEGIIREKIEEVKSERPRRVPTHNEEKLEDYTERTKYLASLEVLLDIVEINYRVRKNPNEIEGYPPVMVIPPDPDRNENDPREYKRVERQILQKERRAQFDQSTRNFIREMEEPDHHNGRSVSILDLIADGEALCEDLSTLADHDRDTITDQLDEAIEPYIQVAEKGVTDPQTGMDLNDIWRYFRYTWLTPYNSVPGRNINFLVRDAAREYHPVMGIASLASSMMNLKDRDKHIGWRIDALEAALERRTRFHEIEHQLPEEERTDPNETVTKTVREHLETEAEWEQRVQEHCSFIRRAVQNAIDESIENIRYDDFIDHTVDLTEEHFAAPTETTYHRLKQLEGRATYIYQNEPPLISEVEDPDDHDNLFDPAKFDLTPSDLENVGFEDTDPEKYEQCTLAEIGVTKAELEALAVEKPSETDSKATDGTEPLWKRITEADPASIQLTELEDLQINLAETDLESFGPVDFDDIEGTVVRLGAHVKFHLKSETALFVKKRAHTLQTLLRDREYFLQHADQDDDRAFIENALESTAGERALRTALKEIKKRRVGAGMMNIQVCGAIPPYNHILGGKLVAMALTGPEVIEAYREKYEGYESEIASSMKGAPVIKENELVFLDTTSLFKVGSAQYDRVRVPTPDGTIEYEEIGMTNGYGSVQFGTETRKLLSEVTELLEDRQIGSGRFGEGIAPKMRKIRHGLENLELDGDLLKHESPRIIYAVELTDDFQQYLFGLTNQPKHRWTFEDVSAEQQTIYDHWKDRWVSKRIQKSNILKRIQEFDKRRDLALGLQFDLENNHSLDDYY